MTGTDGKHVLAHNIKFYNPKPRAIHCMAIDSKRKKLAVSRSDNSVEIWDVKYAPFLEKCIFNEGSSTVEDVKWHDDRLFSCGLHGCVVEYDLFSESILNSVPVTGGPAWCIDIHPKKNLLACGTEDGYINILEVLPEGLEHYKFLDKQQGRILCMCWEKSGQHLVTGSMDVIRVWNVEKGHAIHKMMMGRSQENKETIVWSLCVTSDFTVISGDSRGYLCFWDGKLGTQIENFHSHEADIFTVALNEDETSVYCSGVDPLIATYAKVHENQGNRRRWAKGGIRRIHELDVRALALRHDGKLFSGGVDGYLMLSSLGPKTLLRSPPLIKGPCVKVVTSKRYLMLRYLTHLEVWKLGRVDHQEGPRLAETETLLLSLKAREGDVIISSSVSSNGQFVAYSTNTAIRFFKLSIEGNPSLIKLPDPTDCGPCRLVEFYELKKRQFCAVVTKKNEIHIMEVGECGPDIVHTIKPTENELLKDTISHLVLSVTDAAEDSYLIAADCASNVAVWSVSNWGHHCRVPRYEVAITAVAAKKSRNTLVIAYSDLHLVEFSLADKRYTELSKLVGSDLKSHFRFPAMSITFDDRRDTAIIVQNYSTLCVVDESLSGDVEEDEVVDAKIAKLSKGSKWTRRRSNGILRSVQVPRMLISANWLDRDEMVMVTVSPLKMAENYPDAYKRKRFLK